MFNQVLQNCRKNYLQMHCCHDRAPELCNCDQCLCTQYDHNDIAHEDTYECHKKLNYYVLKYGPSHISEIYHYLNKSNVLERFNNQNINILSLGCGFGPDYYAISQYIENKHLNIKFNYCGLDNSIYWCTTRIPNINANFILFDLINPFSFETNQIIIMNKVFSTITKCGGAIKERFLHNLINAIDTMPHDTVLIFNDINHRDLGRDELNDKIEKLFDNKITRYYTDTPYYHPSDWINISENNIICQSINDGNIRAYPDILQTVFFEYWK